MLENRTIRNGVAPPAADSNSRAAFLSRYACKMKFSDAATSHN
jgi:hypothetical protein